MTIADRKLRPGAANWRNQRNTEGCCRGVRTRGTGEGGA